MPRLTPVSPKELIKRLKILGFQGPYTGGKHLYMIKGELRLTIPNPHKETISVGLLRRILRQANINRDDWLKLK